MVIISGVPIFRIFTVILEHLQYSNSNTQNFTSEIVLLLTNFMENFSPFLSQKPIADSTSANSTCVFERGSALKREQNI